MLVAHTPNACTIPILPKRRVNRVLLSHVAILLVTLMLFVISML